MLCSLKNRNRLVETYMKGAYKNLQRDAVKAEIFYSLLIDIENYSKPFVRLGHHDFKNTTATVLV
jgi:hypothetical protein